MGESVQIAGPKSWSICQIRLWADIHASEFANQIDSVQQLPSGAELIQLGPREWWIVSEAPVAADLFSKAAANNACVVDFSAAYLAFTLKGGSAYRTLSRIGNAHDQKWLPRIKARRLRVADCNVIVLARPTPELGLLVARSEAGHVLMAVREALKDDAPQ